MIAKVLLVIAFVAVAVAVGIYCRRHTGTVDGFILGGRNVGPWMSAFAYGTSYFSAVVFVGYAGQFGFKYGISATWAGIGNAIIGSLLAWWVLGPRTREMTHRLQASTMPEFFGKRYDSRALRIAAAAEVYGVECIIGCMLEAKISVNAAVELACAKKIITKVDLDGPVLCSEDHILGGAVFNEKDITVSDAPGMGIKGFVPGKVTYLDD